MILPENFLQAHKNDFHSRNWEHYAFFWMKFVLRMYESPVYKFRFPLKLTFTNTILTVMIMQN